MNVPLQQFEHDRSPYERPNQRWVCGRAANGNPCAIGPSTAGSCRATTECDPVKKGDRWLCARSKLRGGPCEHGPLPSGKCCTSHPPCQPVRSLRAKRGVLAFSITALTLGLLLIAFFSSWRTTALNPGPLTLHHAQILEGKDAKEQCAVCHAAGDKDGLGIVSAAFFTTDKPGPTQSELCLKCHQRDEAFTSDAMYAHGLSPDSWPAASKAHHGEQVACATCHREHHGKDYNLKALSDAQCQACHSNTFNSFSNGHPEFGDYPYRRRTRIVFDHGSHSSKHFAAQKQSFDCRECHTPDPQGAAMLVKPFTQSCASCHDQNIKSSFDKGIAFFQLPGIDVETLEKKGFHVGQWPKDATIDIDGKLNPYMKLLLWSDPKAQAAMQLLGDSSLNGESLASAPKEKLQAVADLAWAVKGFLFDLTTQGQDAYRVRLEKTLDDKMVMGSIHLLSSQLPLNTIASAQEKWMPELLSEVPQYRAGKFVPPAPPKPKEPEKPKPAPKPDKPEDDSILCADDDDILGGDEPADKKPKPSDAPKASVVPPKEWLKSGGWYRDDAAFAIRYIPLGHADSIQKTWLQVVGDNKIPPGFPDEPSLYHPLSELFVRLTHPTASGLCLKCHSTDLHVFKLNEKELALSAINWGLKPTRGYFAFTNFAHAPHLIQDKLKDCVQCHTLDPKPKGTTDYGSLDPHKFVPQFQPMSKTSCVACHTPKAAGSSCLQCHNYHVRSRQ